MHDVAELSWAELVCWERKKEMPGISLQRNKWKTQNQINRWTKAKKRKNDRRQMEVVNGSSQRPKGKKKRFSVIFIKKKKKRKIWLYNNWKKEKKLFQRPKNFKKEWKENEK